MYRHWLLALLLTFFIPASFTFAFTPKSPLVEKFQQKLNKQAKKEDPNFSGFSAERGKKFYQTEYSGNKKKPFVRSCATCHTDDPMNRSKHVVTGKKIDPLSPKVNRKRFSKEKKIKKWFRRNCKWTLKRQCTAQEKGDFIEYIFSL